MCKTFVSWKEKKLTYDWFWFPFCITVYLLSLKEIKKKVHKVENLKFYDSLTYSNIRLEIVKGDRIYS